MSRKSFIQGAGTGAFFLCLIAAPIYYHSGQKVRWMQEDLAVQISQTVELEQLLLQSQKQFADCDYQRTQLHDNLAGEQARVAFRDQQIDIWKSEHQKMQSARDHEIATHSNTYNEWKKAEAAWIEERVRLETLPPAEKQLLQARLAQAESALRKARHDLSQSAHKATWIAFSGQGSVAAIRPLHNTQIQAGQTFILCNQDQTLASGKFLRPHEDAWLVSLQNINKSLSTLVKDSVLHIFDHHIP